MSGLSDEVIGHLIQNVQGRHPKTKITEESLHALVCIDMQKVAGYSHPKYVEWSRLVKNYVSRVFKKEDRELTYPHVFTHMIANFNTSIDNCSCDETGELVIRTGIYKWNDNTFHTTPKK